jgi:hypothetical protein
LQIVIKVYKINVHQYHLEKIQVNQKKIKVKKNPNNQNKKVNKKVALNQTLHHKQERKKPHPNHPNLLKPKKSIQINLIYIQNEQENSKSIAVLPHKLLLFLRKLIMEILNIHKVVRLYSKLF